MFSNGALKCSCTFPLICASLQPFLWGLQTIPWTSQPGFSSNMFQNGVHFHLLSNKLDSLQTDFSPGVETSEAQWEEPGCSWAQTCRKGCEYFRTCVSRLQKFQANLFNSESRNQFHATTAWRGSFYSVLIEFQHQLKMLEVQEQADGDSNLEAEDTEWEHEETSWRSSSC